MFAIGLMTLPFISRLLFGSVKAAGKLLLNAIIGALVLLLINIIGSNFGFTIPINALNSLIVGVTGVPGAALLAIWYFIF